MINLSTHMQPDHEHQQTTLADNQTTTLEVANVALTLLSVGMAAALTVGVSRMRTFSKFWFSKF